MPTCLECLQEMGKKVQTALMSGNEGVQEDLVQQFWLRMGKDCQGVCNVVTQLLAGQGPSKED